MAINLLNSVNNNNTLGQLQNNSVDGAVQSAGQSALRQAANAILGEIRSLMPGDTLQGQLVAKDGNSIQLLLAGNTILSTALEEDVNVTTGGIMSFEVKSNHGGQLTLRPLFTNMSNSTNIMNALNAAGIPASDATIEMVDTLMQKGMSVNKELLQTINREMSMYPEADIKDIVMLHKMEIPVTSQSIEQMHLYRNNNRYMLDNVSDISDKFLQLFEGMTDATQGEVEQLISGLKDIFSKEVVLNPQSGEVVSMPAESTNIEESSPNTVSQMATTDETNVTAGNEKAETAKAMTGDMNPAAKVDDNAANVNKTLTNVITKDNVFDILADTKHLATNLAGNKQQIKAALTEVFKDHFLMEPDEIDKDAYVKKYYERVSDITDKLGELLAKSGKADTPINQSVTSLKSNITFLNQVNELYNYVQLPLKMNETQANGDLYVYSRKRGRGMGGDDGKLTALLHLSMEHLGNMDIFLALQNEKLSTRFCMEKEEMIDFIESHIDELNQRLAGKGYNVVSTVDKMESNADNVIERIVQNDGGVTLISTRSFDARA